MLKIKKIFSALVGTAMAANVFMTMPFSAFADEESSRTYTYDGYEVSYDVTNSWGNTEKISVTISNTGDSTIENWMLAYDDFNGDIDGIWDATVVEVDAESSYIRNAGYNANIAPNASVSFGYNLTNPESVPESIVMCQKRVTKSNDDFSASLNVTNDWGSAFNAEILLRNDMDKPLEWWELEFDTNFTITEITTSWAAEKFNLGDASYMFKGTYTGIVPPQSTVALGFSGIKNEGLDDPMITINGLTEVVFGGFPNNVDVESARQAELEYIKGLNENANYPAEFGFNNNGTVYSIDGKFSNVAVVDAESALLALNDVKNLLGMRDPASQLVLDYIYTSELADYKSYFFKEVYNGVTVYDRTVTIVARNNGETLSLDSNFLEIADFDIEPEISNKDIESKYNTETAELSIYTFEEYEKQPILTYFCSTADEKMICSAQNGEIIDQWQNDVFSLTEKDDLPISRDIYDYSLKSSRATDINGNLIWNLGEFGSVTQTSNIPILNLSLTEKNDLKINNTDVTFNFAQKSTSYMLQLVSGEKADRDAYIKNHPGSVAVSNYLYEWQDENDDWYVDVSVDIYNFDQIYKNYLVYGRTISLTVNDEGRTAVMDSNILNNSVLEKITIPNAFISNEAAVQKVLTKLNITNEDDRIVLESNSLNNSLPVIYSWETDVMNYENNPIFAYIVLDRIDGKTYIVDATNGEIVLENYLGKGLSETSWTNARKLEYFPITAGIDNYSMESLKPNGSYNNKVNVKYKRNVVTSNTSFFYEPEAVTAYQTILKVYNFYEQKLNHSSYDDNRNGKERTITVNVKTNSNPGAAASAGVPSINYYIRNTDIASYASSLSIGTHEFNHFIFQEYNGGIPRTSTTTRAINEGYSDLFGFIMTEWNGNCSLPSFNVDFDSSNLQYLIDDDYTTIHGHSVGGYVVYPAYLMKSNGLDTNDIAHLYYASITMGKYNSSSSLNSVRVNVIKAAKALGLDNEKLTIVREALDEVWENDNRVYDFTLNVKEYLNPNVDINNVTVKLKKNLDEDSLVSKEAGGFVYTVEPGCTYLIEVSAPGYVTYRNKVHMYYMENNSHTAELIKINYDANGNEINGSALIKAVDRVTNLPVGAIVKFETYDESFKKVYLTDDTGTAISYLADPETGYTNPISIAPGYYYPIVSEADNYFVKPMMKIASDNEIPDESNAFIYYDTNMNGDLKSYFFSIAVNEYHETETSFNAFDTLTVDTDADAYVGRSGPTQFGRELYMVCYEPEMETSFDFVFRPTSEQLEKLEAILKSEGNLCTDPNTGKNVLGHLGRDENNNRIVIAEPSSKSYYNIEIAGNNIGITNPTVISAWELYEGLMNNNGVYPLSKIIFDGNGKYSFQ